MRYFFDVTHGGMLVTESDRWEYSTAYSQTDDVTPILKFAFLAPLLMNAGRMAATQGAKQIGKVGVKAAAKGAMKNVASKEGMKNLTGKAGKHLASKEGVNAMMDGMANQGQAKQQKDMQLQQEQQRVMDAGRSQVGIGV